MQNRKLAFAILIATAGTFMLGAQGAYAALTVCKLGCDYTNIQDAVTAASDGEVIRIQQGVFIGPISINNKNLTLQGSGSSVSIIDRGPAADSPAPPAINVSCSSTHKIIISNVTITGGTPYHHFGGGGVVNENCDVTLTNTLIANNTRRAGGGIGNEGKMLLKNSTISGNAAELGGGGIGNDGELSIIGSFIVGNSTTTPGKGGGIDNAGTLEVRSSTITANQAPDGGGFSNEGAARLIDTIIVNNISSAGGGGEGGGLWNLGSLELTRSLLIGNTADNQGGGVFQREDASVKMTNSTLINNSAGTTGGGLYADGTVTANSKTIIQGNTPNNCAGGAFVCP